MPPTNLTTSVPASMMPRLLRCALLTPGLDGRWGLPLLVEGDPGAAKTSTFRAIAARLGFYFLAFLGSLRTPEDFIGVMVSINGRTTYLPLDWVADIVERSTRGVRTLILFDEVNTCRAAVQAVLLRIILEGVVGSYTLPPGCRFAAAMNDPRDTTGALELSNALNNRFGHLPWVITPTPEALDEWGQYMASIATSPLAPWGSTVVQEVDPEEEEKRVLDGWAEAYAPVHGLVQGFIRAHSAHWHSKPKEGVEQKAWPSPRTWEMATRALAGARLHGLSEEETDALVGAYVGEAASIELASYRAANDLPDPAALLDGRISWLPRPERPDRSLAVAHAAAAVAQGTQGPRRGPRAIALWDLLSGIATTAPDMVLAPAKGAITAGLDTISPDARRIADRLLGSRAVTGVIDAAGGRR